MEGCNPSNVDGVKSPGFRVNVEQALVPLWSKFTTMEAYDHVSNVMLMHEHYNRIFKIDANPDNPLSIASMKEATDFITNSILENTIRLLITYRLTEHTGLSIKEALQLPTYELKMVFRQLKRIKVISSKKSALDMNLLTK